MSGALPAPGFPVSQTHCSPPGPLADPTSIRVGDIVCSAFKVGRVVQDFFGKVVKIMGKSKVRVAFNDGQTLSVPFSNVWKTASSTPVVPPVTNHVIDSPPPKVPSTSFPATSPRRYAHSPAPPSRTEASELPGPSSPAKRKFGCPVPGCDASFLLSHQLFVHVDKHIIGSLPGVVPDSFFKSFRRCLCQGCKKGSVMATSQFHKHCRPSCDDPLVPPCDLDAPSAPPPISDSRGSLPSLESVFSSRVPTVKHIPHSCRQIFAETLRSLFNAASFDNSMERWILCFMFPKCMLASSLGKSRSPMAKLFRSRLAQWNASEYMALWNSVLSPATSSPPRSSRLARSKLLARQGEFARACAALTSDPPALFSTETLEALKSKHPSGPPVTATPSLPRPISVSSTIVRDMVFSFPAASSPGPLGLRAEHLRICVNSSSRFLPSLTIVVNMLLSGRLLPALAPFMAGANLSALLKKDGGTRPLACGNVLRRLASKCICAVLKPQCPDFFLPFQHGVSVPGGAESIIHHVRSLFEKDPSGLDLGLLKIDFLNAFNCISRQIIFEELSLHFPEVVPYFLWCYGCSSHLFFGSHSIPSSRGVQQGDPLGPFLFSLALQKLCRIMAVEFPDLPLNKWYLDDGNIVAPFPILRDVLSFVENFSTSLGLTVNRSKSELIGLSSPPPSDMFPQVICKQSCCEVLGSPIGSAAFCNAHVTRKLSKSISLIEMLPQLDDTQMAFSLLRSCCNFGKIVFFLRTTPSHLISDACTFFDHSLKLGIEKVLGISLSSLPATQTSLPLSMGGFGLRRSIQHSSAAFLASVFSAVKDSPSLLSTTSILKAIENFNSLVSHDKAFKPVAERVRQKHLSRMVESHVFDNLLQKLDSHGQARLRSAASPHAMDWLLVLPAPSTKFSNVQFSVLVRLFLGIPYGPTSSPCPSCNSIADPLGLHAVTCRGNGDIISRHNAFRDTVWNHCALSGLSSVREKKGILGDIGGKRRPADVLVHNWSDGKDWCLDMAVTSPTQDKFLLRSSLVAGTAADSYFEAKLKKYDKLVSEAGLIFLPFVVETFGRFHPKAFAFLQTLAHKRAHHDPTGLSVNLCKAHLFSAISFAIQIRNAQMVLDRMPR